MVVLGVVAKELAHIKAETISVCVKFKVSFGKRFYFVRGKRSKGIGRWISLVVLEESKFLERHNRTAPSRFYLEGFTG